MMPGAVIAAVITGQRSFILDKICVVLTFVQDGSSVRLLVSAVVQGCDTECARGCVLLFAVVLWRPVACFGDSPDRYKALSFLQYVYGKSVRGGFLSRW